MYRYDLSLLFSRTHNDRKSVLSVYLNVDQSRRENRNRGFEGRLKKMTSSLQKSIVDTSERERYATAAHYVKDFISVYRPEGKAIVMFFDAEDGFFSHYECEFVVTDQIHWERELLLQPLANAIDQLEAYGVALVDRAKARLFVVSLGKIEEVSHEDQEARKVRPLKTAGIERSDAGNRLQRKADSETRQHLRSVAKRMDDLARSKSLHRFVLLGTPQITAELRQILPVRVGLDVMGEAIAAIDIPAQDLLSLTRPLAEKYELDSEVEKVSKIVNSAAKGGKAVVGLGRTLKAVNADRVWELIYSGDYLSPGYECTKCSGLFSARPTRCPYCSSRIQAVKNVVERAVEHALRHQAKVEVVTGKASAALRVAGGIGAFLKTRTGSLQA
jgi:peptide subunit release factor 1 (eRF1)